MDMIRRHSRAGAALLACSVLTAAGCTASVQVPGPGTSSHPKPPVPKAVTPATLTAFHSCPEALASLRQATGASVTAFSPPGAKGYSPVNGVASAAAGDASGASAPLAAAAPGASAADPAGASAYSGTNDYTAGVDEPDLVKTDGRRIVTVSGETLIVIDAVSRHITGRLDLASDGIAAEAANLLLSGDHALLIVPYATVLGASGSGAGQYGPRFYLIDLAGEPRVMGSYSIDGNLIDARQVGSVVRIVTGSSPVIAYPALPGTMSNARRVAAYRAVTAQAGLDAWLPRYDSSGGGTTISGSVPCTAISRPQRYSGTNLLTLLTFDLSANTFGTGDPASVVADGSTVYGTASSLYVASGELARPWGAGQWHPSGSGAQQDTQIYRFDITRPGAPRFVASGSVPGYLVNQYALSEWNGYLRVATTTGTSWAIADGRPAGAQTSSSALYVLTTSGPVMRAVGQVTGLGTSERIYAVRFMGPVAYVVTFRQTDPLYTLDLSDPARPHVVGALALTGYSAYLEPVSAARLIGVGQQADAVGHVLGTQVSLFDVSDLAAPARLATYALASSMSAAQADPHAFLYWPADQLVVIPIQAWGSVAAGPAGSAGSAAPAAQSGALVLRVTGTGITRAGFITQPPGQSDQSGQSGPAGAYGLAIERSLVIGQTLWTVSAGGVLASDLATLRQQAWLPFALADNPYPERTVAPASAVP